MRVGSTQKMTDCLLIIFGRSVKQFEGDLGDLRVKDLTPRTASMKTLTDFWILLVGRCRKKGHFEGKGISDSNLQSLLLDGTFTEI